MPFHAANRQSLAARLPPNVGPVLVMNERRRKFRYPIQLRLRYEIHKRKKLIRSGIGTTIDVSSKGILLRSDEPLAVGATIQLAIDWPFTLNQACGLHLAVYGRVLRSDDRGSALAIRRFEFRTFAASKVLVQELTRATEAEVARDCVTA